MAHTWMPNAEMSACMPYRVLLALFCLLHQSAELLLALLSCCYICLGLGYIIGYLQSWQQQHGT